MAVTIVRTPWIDDDGTGTTGTVLNNAVKTALYNDIDGALAKVPQLAGGNTFTGNQTLTGIVSVTGLGVHTFTAGGSGGQTLLVSNSVAGAANFARVSVGNDVDPALLSLWAFSSTYALASDLVPNGAAIRAVGTGGLTLTTTVASPIRFWTNFIERMRIAPTGEVFVNSVINPALGKFVVVADGAASQVILAQNSNAGNLGTFFYCLNSAAVACGSIAQSGATGVLYNTTSDARLKDDAGRATDVSGLRAVVVHDFAWKADGRSDRGVFAQDAHALFPRAVSVGTDETTDDGTLKHPWMTDYSKFVPDLIVGWQHHDADLAELRALLVTLKGSADAE